MLLIVMSAAKAIDLWLLIIQNGLSQLHQVWKWVNTGLYKSPQPAPHQLCLKQAKMKQQQQHSELTTIKISCTGKKCKHVYNISCRKNAHSTSTYVPHTCILLIIWKTCKCNCIACRSAGWIGLSGRKEKWP